MIYVASQEGLPGFLFHLQKKELCWKVIREPGIKLTAAVKKLLLWMVAVGFQSQPELEVGRDQLEKSCKGRETFLNGGGFFLWLCIYLERMCS